MKTITLSCFLLLGILGYSQDVKLVFFSEGGEKFTIIVNGQKKNIQPSTRVEVDQLSGNVAYRVTAKVEGLTTGDITKTIYPEPNTTNTVAIKKNRKGKYVMRFMGSGPYVSESPQVQNTAPGTTESSENTGMGTGSVNTSTKTSVGSEETISTTAETTVPGNKVEFSMQVKVDENTGNTSVNTGVNEGSQTVTTITTNADGTTETVTTTTTMTSTGSGTSSTYEQSGYKEIPIGHGGSDETAYNEPVKNHKCDYPMDNGDFVDAKKSISLKSFEDDKLKMAIQVIRGHCPTSEQVKGFMEIMGFESSRLEVAKFAHEHCYDKANYYKVNDAFQFSSSIDELDEYLENR